MLAYNLLHHQVLKYELKAQLTITSVMIEMSRSDEKNVLVYNSRQEDEKHRFFKIP